MAVITAAASVLAHAPGLVRYGSKPVRDLARDPTLIDTIVKHLRRYEDALAYAPNQAYLGTIEPDDLRAMPRPWFGTRVTGARALGPFGDFIAESELLGLLKRCDRARLVQLDEETLGRATQQLSERGIASGAEMSALAPAPGR